MVSSRFRSIGIDALSFLDRCLIIPNNGLLFDTTSLLLRLDRVLIAPWNGAYRRARSLTSILNKFALFKWLIVNWLQTYSNFAYFRPKFSSSKTIDFSVYSLLWILLVCTTVYDALQLCWDVMARGFMWAFYVTVLLWHNLCSFKFCIPERIKR